jgi:CDGSH-type Zn-finger protein
VTTEELEALVLALQRDVTSLRTRESIERTIVSYARACDRGNDPVLLAPLFTIDAAWECKGFGRYEGRDKVARALRGIAGEKIWWSLHYMISPMIDIAADGQSASAFWYLWEAATIPNETSGEAEACWVGATYQAQLRLVETQWLFSEMELILNMVSPVHEGWVRKRFPGGTAKQPYFLQLEAGKYLWCACGKSATPPFCDGSHEGGRIKPIPFEVEQAGPKAVCGCRYSRTKPWCDGAHLNMKL